MSTLLTKPVTRELRCTAFERGHRNIVVALHPGDKPGNERIAFRLKGTRRVYSANLRALFDKVVFWDIGRERLDIERRAKQLVKDHGMKVRSARAVARHEVEQRREKS